ncbi:hypothetical protein [Paenibacillus thalictri]|uniref:Hydrolase n=1 Tax=Paenibacillus thalictri TaxID=2527873 RepID=A0A4Q9DFY6_9BACL|nr:hypothetical protein [Paenibacillus thalictri]TBL68203.1 hypothetical protein EYB31_38640 [Paenibacillus thalictri]
MNSAEDTNKKTYYVSVQAGTIMNNIGDASFEFEIIATPDDIERLSEMFEATMEADHDAFWRAHNPAISYHHDDENDTYDEGLQMIYSTLHELGTPETKHFIEEMHVLPQP